MDKIEKTEELAFYCEWCEDVYIDCPMKLYKKYGSRYLYCDDCVRTRSKSYVVSMDNQVAVKKEKKII